MHPGQGVGRALRYDSMGITNGRHGIGYDSTAAYRGVEIGKHMAVRLDIVFNDNGVSAHNRPRSQNGHTTKLVLIWYIEYMLNTSVTQRQTIKLYD